MSVTAIYTSLFDDRAARRRAGLPAALRHTLTRLVAWQEQAVARQRVEKQRRDAAHVRSLAEHMRASDPSMAADLDAAIDRQEIAAGIGG